MVYYNKTQWIPLFGFLSSKELTDNNSFIWFYAYLKIKYVQYRFLPVLPVCILHFLQLLTFYFKISAWNKT